MPLAIADPEGLFLRTGQAPPGEARQHPPAESSTKALFSASSTAP